MKEREQHKNHIIREGLKALYRKGYNATGVQEITNSAGIPKGSFYNYFRNKEEFAVEAMRLFTDREFEMMQGILSDTMLPPLDRIRVLYQRKIEFLTTKAPFSLGCFLCNITLEMADSSKIIAQEATRCFAREYEPLIACFKEAKQKRAIAKDTDIQQLTRMIRNCWLGTLVIMKAEKSGDSLREFLTLLDQMLQSAAE